MALERAANPSGSRRARGAAFALILAWMVLGPAYRQLLGGQTPWVPRWVMFSGAAKGVVVATFAQRLPDGSERAIDRFALLGYPGPGAAPSALRILIEPGGTARVVARICERLGPEADVRVRSRVSASDGWRDGELGERNACAEAPEARSRVAPG